MEVGVHSAHTQSAQNPAVVDIRNVPENATTLFLNTAAEIAKEISPKYKSATSNFVQSVSVCFYDNPKDKPG